MPLPTIANVFRVAFEWTDDNDPHTATNVMHFLAPGKSESDVFDALDANVQGAMWALTHNAVQIHEVKITKLDGVADTFIFPTGDTVGWSGSGGTSWIPQVCALIKLSTGAGGRRGRGRVYLPWLAEGLQEGGVLDGTERAAAEAAWITFANDMAAAGVALVVASYTGVAVNQVQAINVEALTATQRRRFHRG